MGLVCAKADHDIPVPLHSGDPSFDLNCRCRVTARVKCLQDEKTSNAQYTYKEWKQEQDAFNAVPKDETGWKRSIEVFRRFPEEAARKVNPHYNDGKNWRMNCQRCVPAYGMRRRGYDAQAKPAILDKTDRVANDWKDVFENVAWKKIPYDKDDFREIIKSMSEWGAGARCEICVAWDERNGHIFCAEQIDGKTVFYDP
ncbi:MAG: toxin glutamine deamidase domain-containing protein [Sphaerochaetaceae bacterium]|nr:toxin glutamine deamidase domain-containing protein [Spirochaetales bacterium]MDY5498925.1 toxin glutamine deamidase domain-containing protein [Sphaerochaetaceae bacterium]